MRHEELLQHLFRVETDLLGVGAHVGPPEQAARPACQVVAFEPFQQGDVDFGVFSDCRELHVLLFTLHHIVSDGWSMGVLLREVGALYGAFVHGEPDGPVPFHYPAPEFFRDILDLEGRP